MLGGVVMLEGAAGISDRWSGGARVVVVAIDAERRCEFIGEVGSSLRDKMLQLATKRALKQVHPAAELRVIRHCSHIAGAVRLPV